MITRRLAAVLASGMFILGACNSTASNAPAASGGAPASGAAATGCKVGVSWNTLEALP